MVSFVFTKAWAFFLEKSHLFPFWIFLYLKITSNLYFSKNLAFLFFNIGHFLLAFAHFSGFSLISAQHLSPPAGKRAHSRARTLTDYSFLMLSKIAAVTMERIETWGCWMWMGAPSWTLLRLGNGGCHFLLGWRIPDVPPLSRALCFSWHWSLVLNELISWQPS